MIKKEHSDIIEDFLYSHIIKDEYNNSFQGKEDKTSFINLIKKHYPEYLYQGSAYRIVFLNNKKIFRSLNRGDSFSASFSGLISFYQNTKNTDSKYVGFIESKITGIDIAKLIEDVKLRELNHKYFNEDEIILDEVQCFDISIMTRKKFSSFLNSKNYFISW